jgi:hypothetical protein
LPWRVSLGNGSTVRRLLRSSFRLVILSPISPSITAFDHRSSFLVRTALIATPGRPTCIRTMVMDICVQRSDMPAVGLSQLLNLTYPHMLPTQCNIHTCVRVETGRSLRLLLPRSQYLAFRVMFGPGDKQPIDESMWFRYSVSLLHNKLYCTIYLPKISRTVSYARTTERPSFAHVFTPFRNPPGGLVWFRFLRPHSMFCHEALLTEDAALAPAVCSEGCLGANALLLPNRIGNNNTNLHLQSRPHQQTKAPVWRRR